MHAHFPADVREDDVAIFELHAKHRVWQRFEDLALDFNQILLTHAHLGRKNEAVLYGQIPRKSRV